MLQKPFNIAPLTECSKMLVDCLLFVFCSLKLLSVGCVMGKLTHHPHYYSGMGNGEWGIGNRETTNRCNIAGICSLNTEIVLAWRGQCKLKRICICTNCRTIKRSTDSKPVTHEIWDGLLKKYVDKNGFVDYKGFRSDSAALNQYLAVLEKAHPNDK